MNTLPFRRTILEMCVQLSHQGHFSGTGGNIALRIDAEHIAVTPSATDYLTMSADDVCVLRLSDLRQVEGSKSPSVESGLHAQVLRARPDVQASVHTHQPVASACALLGRALTVPPRWQGTLGAYVPVVGYAPSGSSWLASRLAGALRPDINAYLMRNHGILCCGGDSAAALHAVDDLEALARQHLTEQIANQARSGAQPQLWRVIEALQPVAF